MPPQRGGSLHSRDGSDTFTFAQRQLFPLGHEARSSSLSAEPRAAYADYYERALYNHILASIHPTVPGYVYFTPIRPAHYRVYSQPGQGFWCCVGSGMENPGKYGAFIFAQAGTAST